MQGGREGREGKEGGGMEGEREEGWMAEEREGWREEGSQTGRQEMHNGATEGGPQWIWREGVLLLTGATAGRFL